MQATSQQTTITASPSGKRGFPQMSTALDLAAHGYIEEEFLIAGTAQTYISDVAPGTDGRWSATVAAATAQPYVTRLLVRRLIDASRFNGTAIVEWLNVTTGADLAPDWLFAHVEILRAGHVWIGVSAQYFGVATLQSWDRERYSTLLHPGDSWSYDIFSQAGRAVRQVDNGPLGAMAPVVRTLLATGHSQSAQRLFTYYNAIQSQAQIFDGLLIHGTGIGAPLSQSFAGGIAMPGVPTLPTPAGVPATVDVSVPNTALIRDDLRWPVLFINSETDLTIPGFGAGFSVHAQADSAVFRLWEIAGTAHADAYLMDLSAADATRSGLSNIAPAGDLPFNDGPQTFAMRAALHALSSWVQDGTPPPIGPRLHTETVMSTRGPVMDFPMPIKATVIVRDPATGLAYGGIRLPQIEVPVATITGDRPRSACRASPLSFLFGSSDSWNGDTDPWDGKPDEDPSPRPEPSLRALYGSRENYIARYTAATDAAIEKGFALGADREEILNIARAVTFD